MSKKRHSWGEMQLADYTHFQKCVKCGLYRFKSLNSWVYTKENPELNPFCDHVINTGCSNE